MLLSSVSYNITTVNNQLLNILIMARQQENKLNIFKNNSRYSSIHNTYYEIKLSLKNISRLGVVTYKKNHHRSLQNGNGIWFHKKVQKTILGNNHYIIPWKQSTNEHYYIQIIKQNSIKITEYIPLRFVLFMKLYSLYTYT